MLGRQCLTPYPLPISWLYINMENKTENNIEGFGKIAILATNDKPLASSYQIEKLNAKSISEIIAELEIIKNKLLNLIQQQKVRF